jgi:hypothetical protein
VLLADPVSRVTSDAINWSKSAKSPKEFLEADELSDPVGTVTEALE